MIFVVSRDNKMGICLFCGYGVSNIRIPRVIENELFHKGSIKQLTHGPSAVIGTT
jgi:hypothetical protein